MIPIAGVVAYLTCNSVFRRFDSTIFAGLIESFIYTVFYVFENTNGSRPGYL